MCESFKIPRRAIDLIKEAVAMCEPAAAAEGTGEPGYITREDLMRPINWHDEPAAPTTAVPAETEWEVKKIGCIDSKGTCSYGYRLEKVGNMHATQTEAEAAAAKLNDAEQYVMCGKIAMLVSQDGASVAECEAAARDIAAMAVVRKYAMTIAGFRFVEGFKWIIPNVMGTYHSDPADAILADIRRNHPVSNLPTTQ